MRVISQRGNVDLPYEQIVVRAENQPSKVDFINNAIFQFPQDDEIEV